MDHGYGSSPVGCTDSGRPLELLFAPPTPVQAPRSGGSHLLCCRGEAETSADVRRLEDAMVERLRTGDPAFDEHVYVDTHAALRWLLALDVEGRRAIARAVEVGWTCVRGDWVVPWSMDAQLAPELLPAVDAALDALSAARTRGRIRWMAALRRPEPALRRARLLLLGAAEGWLASDQASALLQDENDPLVRLAILSLFLPDTTTEVAARLQATDLEVLGLAAVSLARTEPSGSLRFQVEGVLIALLDTPLEGLLDALRRVGGPRTIQALNQRVSAIDGWRGVRRERGFELLGALRADALAAGSGPGALSIADSAAGQLGLAPGADEAPPEG